MVREHCRRRQPETCRQSYHSHALQLYQGRWLNWVFPALCAPPIWRTLTQIRSTSMRLQLLAACLLALGIASAQKPPPKNLGLVGARFQPLTYEEMTPAQNTMVDHLLAGERGGLGGPFNVLLRSPEAGDLGQQ